MCYQVNYLIIIFSQIFLQKVDLCVSYSFSLAFIIFLKYKILKIFYFVFFSTKRVDHSNTRLASQLDRNPGNSPVCKEASQCLLYVFALVYILTRTHMFIASPLSYYKL